MNVSRRLHDIAGIPRALRWDEFVYQQGDPVHGLYRVESGTVEIGRLTPSGHELSVVLVGEGEWFGEAEILMGLDRREYFARASGRPSFLYVPLRELSPVCFGELRQLAMDRLFRIQICLADLVPEPPAQRVEGYLRHLANRSDTVRMSIRAISKASGCPRETVNRTLRQLTEKKVIAVDCGTITFLAPERLGL